MLVFGVVEQVQARVERGALARAGRAGHEHQAVGHVDRLDQVLSTAARRAPGRSGGGGWRPCRGAA